MGPIAGTARSWPAKAPDPPCGVAVAGEQAPVLCQPDGGTAHWQIGINRCTRILAGAGKAPGPAALPFRLLSRRGGASMWRSPAAILGVGGGGGHQLSRSDLRPAGTVWWAETWGLGGQLRPGRPSWELRLAGRRRAWAFAVPWCSAAVAWGKVRLNLGLELLDGRHCGGGLGGRLGVVDRSARSSHHRKSMKTQK